MKLYGLIGYPLKHSFSKGYFNEKFLAEGIDAQYVNFEISSIKEFKQILEDHPELSGLNVTSPYKEQVMPLLNGLDKESAGKVGAVNVIKIIRDGKKKPRLIGYNSDIVGFERSIKPVLRPEMKKALILGTGGASKAVFHGLKDLGVESTLVSRSKKGKDIISYADLTREVIQENPVIINATPVGMFPANDICPDIPYEYLTDRHLLYDLIYNPDQTLFMTKGKERGAQVMNGLEMLLLQAFVSWEIWNL